ncbi:hypothetical protein M8J76_008217 [Diaphorina citri]|nr:hypothetical protein M8J76_008217 [Diaphorina citri]
MTNIFRFVSILLILSTLSGHLAWVRSEKIVRENECAAYCSENQQHNTFKYEPGKSYIYKYETHVKTLIVGNSDEHASTKLDTTVIISVLTPCEFSLQLKNSTLIVDSAIAGPYGAQLDARPLQFWFNQGRVDRLCPGFDSDPTFILNVKRGILSAFQTTSIRPDSLHYETDISGLCRTRSQSSPPDPETGLRVSKVKNLRHCGGRSSGLPVHGSQRSGVFDLNAAIRSEQSCVQDFTPSSRILSSAQCEETHVLKPFSQGMQGASILVKQRLTHLVTRNSDELDLSYDDDQISGIFTTLVYATPSTSLLDTSTESSATHEDDSMLRQLLPRFAVLSKSLRVGVGDSIPDAYLEFLTSLRSVSANVMDKLLFTTEGLDRTLLLTLIAQAGTEESLDFLIQQHDYHAISDAEMNRLLPEIQTYQTPSVFSVEKLHELSKSDGVRVAALLPLGSLIYRYCSTVDCQEDETVRSIMRALDYSLPPFCRTYTNKDTLVTSATLKAIGNAGIYTSNLKSCMFEPIGHLEVRLNAIRALRKVPCSDVHTSNALGLFLNTEENIELRLQAYLVSIKCATPALLDRLSNHLLEEPVHQVSSFVLSHLTTLQQSTSSSRHSVRLRQLLQNKLLRSRYSTDKPESAGSNPFKYSTHFGHAFDLPKLSTNGSEAFSINKRDQVTVEADIVYAKSYLPTSLYLNLSLNLFEEEVQLFEFGTRMEGFEGRLETLFGKGGYFPDESVMKLLKSFQSTHAASNLDSRLDPIRAEVTRTPEPRLDLDREEGREYASYFVRVGGEDVRFAHAHEGLAGVMGAFGAQRDKVS